MSKYVYTKIVNKIFFTELVIPYNVIVSSKMKHGLMTRENGKDEVRKKKVGGT